MSRATKKINRAAAAIIRLLLLSITLLLLLFMLYEGAVRGYRFGYRTFAPQENAQELSADTVSYTVREGESLLESGRELEEAGLVWNRYAWVLTARFYEYQLQPGTYSLKKGMSVRQVLDIVCGTGKTDDH